MGFELVFGLVLVLVFIIYGFMILAFTIGLLKIRKPSGSSPEQGNFVSVIIPVRNETGNIHRILEEMRQQDFPVDLMEVIIADDGSEDDTMDAAGCFAKRHPEFPLVLLPSRPVEGGAQGKKIAIEGAVELAKGEIILCTDADTSRGHGWISAMAGSFKPAQLQMVLGPVVFTNEKNLLQKIQSLEFLGIMGTTAGTANLGIPVMCNGANLGYRRSAFIATGGYSKNFRFGSGDDQFLMNAIRKHYGKDAILFKNDRSAIVSTEPEATLGGFLNQRIRWVSKSRGYSDPLVIAVGLVTWLVHLFLFSGFILGIFYPGLLLLAFGLWLGEMVLEYPMVLLMARFFRKNFSPGYYLISQVFQLVYVVFTGLLGLFLPYRWKGRKRYR